MKRKDLIHLKTERLIIDYANAKDAEDLFPFYNSDFVQRYNLMYPHDLDGYRKQLEIRDRDNLYYHIYLKETKKPIGTITLSKDRIRYGVNSKTLSYWLGLEYANQGFMFEALQEFIAYVFVDTDCEILSARAFVSNIASHSLLSKLGFKKEAHLVNALKDHQGKVHDDILYVMFKEDYK